MRKPAFSGFPQSGKSQKKMEKKSRSGKSQGILNLVREIQNFGKSQGILRIFHIHVFGSQMIIIGHK